MAAHANSTPMPGARAPQAFRAALARSRRAALESWIEAAIGLLDAIDGDPDLEPRLSAPERCPAPYFTFEDLDPRMTDQHFWAGGGSDDREADAADEGEEPGATPVYGEAEPDISRVRRSRHVTGGARAAA